MEVVEVIIEGLRGFPRQTRLPLGAALTRVTPIDGRHTVLARALLDALYPETDPPLLLSLVDKAASASRVAVTVIGRDAQTYRILRDLVSGRVSLLKKGKGGFAPLADRPQQVAQAVTAQLGFPQYDVFRELFITRADDIPSRRTDEVIPVASADGADDEPPPLGGAAGDWDKPLPPGFSDPGASESYDHLDDATLRAKLADLDARIAAFAQVADLEFEIDGLQKRIYAIDAKLEPIDSLMLQLKYAQEEASRFDDLTHVPPDLTVRFADIKKQRTALEGRDRDRATRREQLEMRLKRELANAKTPGEILSAAMHDPWVRYGALAALVFVGIGLLGFVYSEALRYVAFLDVVGVLVASAGAWRLIGDAEEGARLSGQLARVDAAERKDRARHNVDESAFASLLERIDVDEENLAGVLGQLGQFRESQHTLAAARAAVDEALPPDERQALQNERTALQKKTSELESTLYELGAGVVGGKAALITQRDALARALDQDAPLAPIAAAAPLAKPAEDRSDAPATVVSAHVVEALVDHASDLFVTDTEGATSRITPRANQTIAFLSDGRFSQMHFSGTGAPLVVDAASAQQVEYVTLPPGDRDIVYFTLKIAILEACVSGGRLPVVFEQAFERFPPQKGPSVGRLVSYMARLTQVILLTTRSDLGAPEAQPLVLPTVAS